MELPPVTLTLGWSTIPVNICQQNVTKAHQTLGMYMTPTGDQRAEAQALVEKSRISSAVFSSNVLGIESCWPSHDVVSNSKLLSWHMTTMSITQLKTIQRTATQSFLAKRD